MEKKNIVKFFNENISFKLDKKLLETYELLQEKYPEVLFKENFEVSEEQLEFFTSEHLKIYSKQSKEIFNKLPKSLIISSGMFGGKTTLSFLIADELEKEGKKIKFLIADTVGESYITARSFNRRVPAERYGKLIQYKEILKKLKNIDVVFLDEFSFLDTDVVEELQDFCLKKEKNIILTGIDSNYLGEKLPVFKKNSKVLKKSIVEECFSFIPSELTKKPLGKGSIRYVKIGNKWILDVGLLPLVVSKEYSEFIKYTTAVWEHTPIEIFKQKKDIIKDFLKPTNQKKLHQEKLFEILKNI